MVQPAADNPEGNRPARDLQDDTGPAAALHPPAFGEPHRDENADHDADGVGPHRYRPEVPDTLDRARNDGGNHGRPFPQNHRDSIVTDPQ